MSRLSRKGLLAAAAGLGLIWLLWAARDPAWVGSYTHGLRPFEVDAAGVRFQWTHGRASFFVPSASHEVSFDLAGHDRFGVQVRISLDGVPADVRQLTDTWQTVRLPLEGQSSRRFRRVDIHVARVWDPYASLGVRLANVRKVGK